MPFSSVALHTMFTAWRTVSYHAKKRMNAKAITAIVVFSTLCKINVDRAKYRTAEIAAKIAERTSVLRRKIYLQ